MPDHAPPDHLRIAVHAACPGLAGLPWRPEAGGRVNRLWRVGAAMVKQVRAEGASPLFPNSAAVEAEALRRLAPQGLAPRLLAAGEGWVAYARVPGRAWRAGPQVAARTLHALHLLPAAGTGLPFRDAAMGSAAVLAQAGAIAAACGGPVPPPPPDPGVPAPARRGLVHGDAVAGNLIVGAAGAVWIDWQCPALGDPAEDLAAFLSPAMQLLYRGRPLAADEASAFLAAYPDPATVDRYRRLAPVLHWRLAVHCLWRAGRGAPGYAAAARLELA